MALIFFDGFDYRTTLVPPWSASNTVSISNTANRNGINGVRGAGNGYLDYFLPSGSSNTIVGFAAKTSNTSNVANTYRVEFYASGTLQTSFRFNSSRGIDVYRGSSTYVTSTPSNLFDPSVWNYFEVRLRPSNVVVASGEAEIHVNGVTATVYSGNVATNVNAADQIRLVLGDAAHSLDDVYIIVPMSGTTNNTFLGDIRVDVIAPSASGTYNQLTPFGSSVNYMNVDEIPANTSDYNYSDVVGATDTYNFTDLPLDASSIAAVQVHMYAAKSSTGSRSVAPVILFSGVQHTGTDKGLSQSYTYYSQMYELNPITGSGWTPSGVNSSEFGVKVRP